MGRLSLSVGWENGPERILNIVYLTLSFLLRLIWVCTVCRHPSTNPSPVFFFADNPFYTALWSHSNDKSSAINNRYPDFIQAVFAWINFIGQRKSRGQQQYYPNSLEPFLVENVQFWNRVRFGDNRLWLSYPGLSNAWFDFIGYVNHFENNLKEILVYSHFWSIINIFCIIT